MGRLHPLWWIFALAACRPAAREAPPPAHDASPTRARTPVRDPLGLETGTEWHFHGEVRRGGDVTQPLTWTTTVATVEQSDGRTLYRVVGWPGDAPDIPARVTIIVVDKGIVHLTLDGATTSQTAWFKLPLTAGAEQCDEESSYCWSVEAAGKGVDIVLRTLPDVTLYHVESGRGVTRYEYHHNGSADDVVLERDEP
jgi:hypothetical protein